MPECLPKTFTVVHLGCRANYADSQEIRRTMEAAGYRCVQSDGEERADVFVVNTCTVTARADHDSRAWVRRAKALNAEATVVATGCYAQIAAEKLVGAGADLVLGRLETVRIAEHVEAVRLQHDPSIRVQKVRRKGVSFGAADGDRSDRSKLTHEIAPDRVRPVLKVQEGCDQCCTFCIIPMTRGHARSLPIEQAVTRYRSMVREGAKEIVLSGINLAEYGRDLPDRPTLADLLRTLETEPGNEWIRISSLEPTGLTPGFLDVVRQSRKICPHFHIPFQSGDDSVLKAMNRPYDRAFLLDAFHALAACRADVSLGADVLVGFPGESDVQFRTTVSLVESIPFTYLHVFPYSPRPGTKAAKMRERVDSATLRERVAILGAIGRERRQQFLSAQLGRELDAIAESPVAGQPDDRGGARHSLQKFTPSHPSPLEGEGEGWGGYPRVLNRTLSGSLRERLWRGTARNYAKVVFQGSGGLRNQVVRIKAEKVQGTELKGVQVP